MSPEAVDRRGWPVGALPALAAILALAVVHVAVAPLSPDYRGWLLPVDHLFVLVLVVGLVSLCAAVGHAVERRVAGGAWPDELGLFLDVAVGIGIVGTLLLVTGALGGFHPVVLAVLLLALLGLTWRELGPLSLRVRDLFGMVRDDVRAHPWTGAVAGLTLVVVVTYFIAAASAPPVDWDALMYHLRIPNEFIAQGGLHLPVDNLHVRSIGLVHMLYVPLLMVSAPAAPALLESLLAVLLAGVVYVTARRAFGARTAMAATTILWGTTIFLLVAATARVGVGAVFFAFLAQAVLLDLDDRPGIGLLVLAGALAGLGFAVKYPELLYAAALGLLVLVMDDRSPGAIARRSVAFGGAALVAALPWLLKNWALLGAPLFPYLAEPTVSPWLRALYAGRAVLPPLGTHYPAEVGTFNLRDLVLAPWRLTIEPEGAEYHPSPLLAVLPFCVLLWRERAVRRLALPALGYLGLLLVVTSHPDLRYLLPALVPLSIIAAAGLVRFVERTLPAVAGRPVLSLALVAGLLPFGSVVGTRLRQSAALPHLIGTVSASDYIATHPRADVRQYAYVRTFLAPEALPDSGRVLMLFEARGYGFGSRVIEDPNKRNWPFLAPLLEPGRCLDDPGFEYVLFNLGSLRYYEQSGLDVGPFAIDRLQTYTRRCLRPLRQDAGLILFQRRSVPLDGG